MFDYTSIKQLAKEQGKSVNDLFVLAPQNDPFYTGSKAQVRDAEWVSSLYHDVMGAPKDVHIRRIHYNLVVRGDILKPNNLVYENTEKDWNCLATACKYARYLNLIPAENFVDRRNPDPELNAEYWQNKNINEYVSSLNVRSILSNIYLDRVYNPQLTQAYHLELWCEKSTMNDILMPLAEKYHANVVTGLGELSITAVDVCVKRVIYAKRPARIFYISDFDPAGEDMPVSVARKIEYYSRKYNNMPNVKLRCLILTKEQCIKYKLPRTPIKDTDSRKVGFEDRHGEGATELDALEALRPGEMKNIITEALKPYFDSDKYYQVASQNYEIQQAIKKEIADKIEGIFEDLSFEIKDFEFPIGKQIENEPDGFLLDTSREYTDQLVAYRQYKAGDGI